MSFFDRKDSFCRNGKVHRVFHGANPYEGEPQSGVDPHLGRCNLQKELGARSPVPNYSNEELRTFFKSHDKFVLRLVVQIQVDAGNHITQPPGIPVKFGGEDRITAGLNYKNPLPRKQFNEALAAGKIQSMVVDAEGNPSRITHTPKGLSDRLTKFTGSR